MLTWEGGPRRDPRRADRRSRSSGTATSRSRSRTATGSVGGHAAGGTEIDLTARRAGSSTPARSASRATATRDAAWLLLDLDARHASFRRVPYDVAATQAEIREQGLPDALAERLGYGV